MEEVKVLTQSLAGMPLWKKLGEISPNAAVLQQASIDDPKEPTFGMSSVQEIQFVLVQILDVLRKFNMIEM